MASYTITASIMRSVCRTSVEKPALSLIKRICYPVPFRSIATEWGKENEINAQDEYVLLQSSNHENLSFRNSGLLLMSCIHILVPHQMEF